METAASVTCHHFVGTEHVVLQDAETQVHREKKATGHEVVKRKLPTAYSLLSSIFSRAASASVSVFEARGPYFGGVHIALRRILQDACRVPELPLTYTVRDY